MIVLLDFGLRLFRGRRRGSRLCATSRIRRSARSRCPKNESRNFSHL